MVCLHWLMSTLVIRPPNFNTALDRKTLVAGQICHYGWFSLLPKRCASLFTKAQPLKTN